MIEFIIGFVIAGPVWIHTIDYIKLCYKYPDRKKWKDIYILSKRDEFHPVYGIKKAKYQAGYFISQSLGRHPVFGNHYYDSGAVSFWDKRFVFKDGSDATEEVSRRLG